LPAIAVVVAPGFALIPIVVVIALVAVGERRRGGKNHREQDAVHGGLPCCLDACHARVFTAASGG